MHLILILGPNFAYMLMLEFMLCTWPKNLHKHSFTQVYNLILLWICIHGQIKNPSHLNIENQYLLLPKVFSHDCQIPHCSNPKRRYLGCWWWSCQSRKCPGGWRWRGWLGQGAYVSEGLEKLDQMKVINFFYLPFHLKSLNHLCLLIKLNPPTPNVHLVPHGSCLGGFFSSLELRL